MRYEGEFKGKPDGQGTLRLNDGRTYTRIWKNGCLKQGDWGAYTEATPQECGFK